MQAKLAGRKLIMVFLDSAGKYSRIGDAERVRRWIDRTLCRTPAELPAACAAAAAGTARHGDPRQLLSGGRRRERVSVRWPSAAEICAAVARSRSSQPSSSRSAGAEIDSPATSLPWSSRCRRPCSARRARAPRRRAPCRTGCTRASSRSSARQLGDAVARVAGQPGAGGIGAHALRVVVRQEQLADRGEMQRRPPADGAHDLHARALAVGALDVDDLVALAHRQVDRLVRQLVQLAHRRQRGIAHVEPRLDQVAELEQSHAEAVAARPRADRRSGRSSRSFRMRCAVEGCRPRLLADLLQRDRILVRGQHVEQGEGCAPGPGSLE